MSVSEQQAKIVQDILAANTLYDVLGVSPSSLEGSSLRKAYLKTSVQVHPDKNHHPQATEAFQRVAEAWGTLSDDGARAIYDAELRGGSGGGFFNRGSQQRQQDGTHYAYDFERANMPNFQEALFMFATAASMFAGSSGDGAGASSRSGSAVNAASDFMETIFWAQKLAEGRNDNDRQQQDRSGGYDEDSSKTPAESATETAAKNPMTSGMALGGGLRAIAATQRMMGMRKSAAATEKVATTVQVAAMGATVLKAAGENPAVQRTLERGSTTLKNNPQIGKSLRASLKMAGNAIQALQQAQQEAKQQEQQQNSGSGDNNTSHRSSAR